MLPLESNESTSDEIICPGGDVGTCTRDPSLSSSQENVGNTYGMSCNPSGGPSQLLGVGELKDGDWGGEGMAGPMSSIGLSSSDSRFFRIMDFGSGMCLDLGSWNNARASRNAGCHASMCLNLSSSCDNLS